MVVSEGLQVAEIALSPTRRIPPGLEMMLPREGLEPVFAMGDGRSYGDGGWGVERDSNRFSLARVWNLSEDQGLTRL